MADAKTSRKQADEALKNKDAFRYDKFAKELVKQAAATEISEQTIFTAAAMRELGDVAEIRKALKSAFKDITDKEIESAIVAGKILTDSVKQTIKRELANKKAERELTDAEFKNLDYQMRMSRIADMKARQALNKYYQDLTKSKGRKFGDKLLDIYNIVRSLNYSGDLGFILRQGGIPMLANSRAWAKSLQSIKPAFQSDEKFELFADKLRNSAKRRLLESYGVEFEEIGDRHSLNEEFLSGFSKKIPFVKQTNRAHAITTDSFRLNVGTQLFDYIDRQNLTDAEKERAREFLAKKWTNIITGKGYMGNFFGGDSGAQKILSTALGAPRFAVSQFQFLYYANPVRVAMLPKGARAVVAKAMIRTYTPVLAVMSILSMLGLVSLDPEDKEFGKINGNQAAELTGLNFLKDMKIDLLGGKKEPFRLTFGLGLKYMLYAALGDSDGMKRIHKEWNAELFGTDDRFSPFLRGKLNPAMSVAYNVATGEDLSGQPYSAKQVPTDLLAPIIFKNFFEAATYSHEHSVLRDASVFNSEQWTTDNAGRVLATLLGEELGVGVTNYPSSPSTVAMKEARTLSTFHGDNDKESPEEKEAKTVVSGLKRLQREGFDISNKISEYQNKGVIDAEDVKKIKEDKDRLPILNLLKNADKETIEKVLKYATSDENWLNNQKAEAEAEKGALEKLLGKKAANEEKKTDKVNQTAALDNLVEMSRANSDKQAVIADLRKRIKSGEITAKEAKEIALRVAKGDDMYAIESGTANEAIEAFERGMNNGSDREKLVRALQGKYKRAQSEDSRRKYREAAKAYGADLTRPLRK